LVTLMVALDPPRVLDPARPLPTSLDPFSLSFRLSARDPSHLAEALRAELEDTGVTSTAGTGRQK